MLGAWTFRASPWATALLIGLSFWVGLWAVHLPALAEPSAWLGPALAASAGVTVGGIVGRALRNVLHGMYPAIWAAAWIVVVGTVAAQLVGSPSEWLAAAAAAVALIFLALAAAWFARLEAEPHPLASLDLYLIGLNLFLAAALLLSTTA